VKRGAIALGLGNYVGSNSSVGAGCLLTINGDQTVGFGYNNIHSGNYGLVAGANNSSDSYASAVFGRDNKLFDSQYALVSGYGNKVNYNHYGFVIGNQNQVNAANQYIFGKNLITSSYGYSGEPCLYVGSYNWIKADRQDAKLVIASGDGAGGERHRVNSFVVGFDSTKNESYIAMDDMVRGSGNVEGIKLYSSDLKSVKANNEKLNAGTWTANSIKIGDVTLTSNKLQKIIDFIDSIEEVN
jgi:hypothetical protein